MYYPSSENKGADQLRGYREADLRLCFRLCRLLVFPWGGSNVDITFLEFQLQALANYSKQSLANYSKFAFIGSLIMLSLSFVAVGLRVY